MGVSALKPSQRISILDHINPQSAAAGTYTTGWVKAAQAEWFLGIAQMGTPGGGGTFLAKLQQASDSGGTGAKDILASVTSNAAGMIMVQSKMDALDINNGFTYVRLAIVVASATSPISGILASMNDRQGPTDEAGVLQMVG